MALAREVYSFAKRFPRDEIYGLTSQMRRAAVSIPSNIAEGYGRGGRDYDRFISIAYGSLLELETQIELSGQLDLAKDGRFVSLLETTARLGRMLNALRRGLQRSIKR